MGLQNTAHYLKSKGRDGDTELVHMSKDEVKGLQALALRHGGSLSINPDTGLPEASFLKRVLPTLAGAGAMFIPGMQPLGAAMIGGGLGLAMSGGNLQAGIMGGLGAWGGASLVSGLMGAGAVGAEAAGLLGDAAIAGGETTAGMVGAANTGLPTGTQTLGGTVTAGGAGGGAGATPSLSSQFDKFSSGIKATDFGTDYLRKNMFPIGAAVAPLLLGGTDQKGLPSTMGEPAQIRPYTYSQERNPDFGNVPGAPYFKQSYTAGEPYNAKEGGIVTLANGGPVERMSAMNTAMNPQGGLYPQGMIDKTQYATPIQRPVSSEMVSEVPAYDRSNPLLMADGGDVKVPPVDVIGLAPNLGQYTQPASAQNPAVAQYNQILAERAANEYVTQAPPLNLLPGGGERASAADTSKIINEYYLKNLGRQAEPEGLEFWTKRKMDTGMSLADINKGIATSGEANIRNFYKQNYDRYATPEEIAAIQQRYAAGESPEAIIADLKSKVPTKPATPAPKATTQKGYTYDPVTQTFTAPTVEETATPGFDINDPNFQNYLRQQYAQYQAAQSGGGSGGGKAGGLMPKALKYASGGIADLGSYSDGGRLLKGPGDGMSDNIPAVIGAKQPARLADGEFVVPADVVSHLGNGSTDAGAKKLYAMMDKIRAARTGKKKQAPAVKADKYMPA